MTANEDSKPLTLGIMKELLAAQMDAFTLKIENSEKKIIENSDKKVDVIIGDVNDLKKKLEEKEEEINQLKRDHERHKRRKNLILHNIPDNVESSIALRDMVIKIIRDECKVDIGNYVDCIFRIGKPDNKKTRPILISLTSFDKKMEVMWSRKQHNSTIELSEDFCKEVCEERRRLSPILMNLRELNYKNVHLKYDKIFVDGVECNEEMLLQLINDKRKTDEIPGIEVDLTASTTVDEEEKKEAITNPTLSPKNQVEIQTTIKRGRPSSDDEHEKNPKTLRSSNKSKTTIIGINNSQNNASTRNPMKDALKKQMAAASSSTRNAPPTQLN